MSDQTIFDKIISKEIKTEIIFENDDVLAFHDVNPQAPIHILVIPKKKMINISDAKSADAGDLGRYMQGIAKTAEKVGLEPSGYRVVLMRGKMVGKRLIISMRTS